MNEQPPERVELMSKLNRETAKIPWLELQHFQQQEAVIEVSSRLDLVAVAVAMAEDNKYQIAEYLNRGEIKRVSAERAAEWTAASAALWAVVVAPWVLVQTHKEQS